MSIDVHTDTHMGMDITITTDSIKPDHVLGLH